MDRPRSQPHVATDAPVEWFRGEFAVFSNFAATPVALDGVRYPTVEHAFQAAKTLDPAARAQFLPLTPGQAKALGRRVLLRNDWDTHRFTVMLDLLLQKFSAEPARSVLLGTGDRLIVENNTWGDRTWGVCRGQGQNHLGRLLMEVRSHLRDGAV
jgi:N-glycosidase YbiA